MNKSKISKQLINVVFSAALMLPLVSITEVALFKSQEAYAQAKRVKVLSIRQKHIKNFEKAQEAMDAGNSSEVFRIIAKIEKDPELNNLERAYIRNFRGGIYFTQDNLSAAAKEFKGIVDNSEGVSAAFVNQMHYILSQVYFSQGNYRGAIKNAEIYIKTLEKPGADLYILIGQAYFKLNQYDTSLANVQKGIDIYRQEGKQPKEGWLNLLASIYRTKKQYSKMVPILKQLIAFYPKKSYMLSLGGIYNELNQRESMTSIYQSMHDAGLLTSESELVTLATLQMSMDNPYKASVIMEEGIKNGVVPKNERNYGTYSQALYLARDYEKAIDPLSKAASLSSNGKKYQELGQSYISLNRWSEGEAAFTKAINKGGLSNAGQAFINLGLAQFNQKKYSAAKSTFNKALKYPKLRKAASNWIKYVDNELLRLKALEEEVIINTDVEAEER